MCACYNLENFHVIYQNCQSARATLTKTLRSGETLVTNDVCPLPLSWACDSKWRTNVVVYEFLVSSCFGARELRHCWNWRTNTKVWIVIFLCSPLFKVVCAFCSTLRCKCWSYLFLQPFFMKYFTKFARHMLTYRNTASSRMLRSAYGVIYGNISPLNNQDMN